MYILTLFINLPEILFNNEVNNMNFIVFWRSVLWVFLGVVIMEGVEIVNFY